MATPTREAGLLPASMGPPPSTLLKQLLSYAGSLRRVGGLVVDGDTAGTDFAVEHRLSRRD
eukprot:3733995-Alexandrium_andersonii.AAC.1